jgi:alpha-galactosidase
MAIDRRTLLTAGCAAAAFGPVVKAAGSGAVKIGNPLLSLEFDLSRGGAARFHALRNASSGFNWAGSRAAIAPLLDSPALPAPAVSLQSWKAEGARIDLVYALGGNVSVEQRYELVAGHPVVTCDTRFRNTASAALKDIRNYGLRLPLRADSGPLDVYCASRDSYAIQRLPFGNELELTGGGWNRPGYAGLLVLYATETQELLLTGIEWERGWRYRLSRADGVIWLQVEQTELQPSLGPGQSMSLPPIFHGTGRGEPDEAFRIAQRYVKSRIAPAALKNWPWVVYDIWGTEAEGVEQALLDEIEPAASLGVELFYVDAAWYQGSSRKGNGDWGCGLGNYVENREKFPRGLAHMSKQVHQHGMKFGLWVGPNIVDSRLVPHPIPQRWVAQQDGADRVLRIKTWESPCLQVCLGCPDYVDYLKTNLVRLVKEFGLDWLKWDNSGIPGIPGECNRADHGHEAAGGSHAALLGQYEVFKHLHAQFPDLVLEQCGYGSRLDLGLARTIRANWLSDASFPSTHVRHNSLVASYVYPSSYNGAWVLRDKELETTTDPALLDTIYRSRMMGLFGFGTLNGTLPERVSLFPPAALEAARRNIPFFKRYRHLLQGDAYHTFPPAGSAEGWQAVQFNGADARQAVILCFRNGSHQASMRLPVKGLIPGQDYKITSANGTEFRSATGTTLLREGLIVKLDKPEMSDVLLLDA